MVRALLITLLLSLLSLPVFAVDYCADGNNQGCWLFTEGSGETVADDSQNTNTGNFKGAGEPAWYNATSPAAYTDWAVDFDGNDDVINCGTDASIELTTHSLVLWASPDVVNVTQAFNDKGDDNLKRSFFIDPTGKLKTQINRVTDNQSRTSNASTISAGSWQHIGMTFTGNIGATAIIIYHAGVEVSYSAGSNGTGAITDFSANAFLIGDSVNGSFSYNGKLTEVGLFDDVLNSTEINDIMDNGLQPAVAAAAGQIIMIMN